MIFEVPYQLTRTLQASGVNPAVPVHTRPPPPYRCGCLFDLPCVEQGLSFVVMIGFWPFHWDHH